MGFYHYLRTVDENGNQTDIGGYSKGGSHKHWILAFMPYEFHNNLEEVVATQNPLIASIGYETTVRLALARLERVKELLKVTKDNLKHPKIDLLHSRLSDKVWSLHHNLSQENPDNLLQLDQTDGFEYALQWDGDKVTRLEEWALQNEAENNEKILTELQQSISFEEAIDAYSASLPNEDITEFQGDLYEFIAHEERSYGPSPISLFMWEEASSSIQSDNPSELFKELIHTYGKEIDEKLANINPEEVAYTYISKDKEESIPHLYSYMFGYLQFKQEMNRKHPQR